MEVKTTFTADLAPFVQGLKTMLTMSAETGQQMKALLNVEIKQPDFRTLDKQLQDLNKSTNDYLSTQQQSTGGEEKHAEATKKASNAVDEKNLKLSSLRRGALQSFGAISFLTISITEMASSAGGGSKELEKMTQGMQQGISAGFGLAGIIGMIVPAMGAMGVGIGVAVAVGITLLRFFDDSEAKAKRSKEAMESWNKSLQGATRGALLEQRATLISEIVEEEKHNTVLKKKLEAYANVERGLAKLIPWETQSSKAAKDLAESTQAIIDKQSLLGEVNKALDDKVKTHTDVLKFVLQAETDAIANQFAQRRQIAKNTYNQELEDFGLKGKEEYQLTKDEMMVLIAARDKYNAEIKRIKDDEVDWQKQKEKQITQNAIEEFEKRYDAEKKLMDERDDAMRAQMNLQMDILNQTVRAEQRAAEERKMAVSGIAQNIMSITQDQLDKQTESTRKLITSEQKEKEAKIDAERKKKDAALKNQRDEALGLAKTQKEKDAINKKYAADQEALDAEYAAQKDALDLEMQEKAKAMNRSAFENNKALAIVNATIDTYLAADKALSSAPPPFNYILMAAVIAAGLFNVDKISSQEVPAFAEGAIVNKPTYALIGEAGPEAVVPLRNIYLPRVRDDILPSSSQVLVINISGNVMTDDFIEGPLKTGIEQLMRKLGASSITEVFLNSQKN
jgi:hypothetical protein